MEIKEIFHPKKGILTKSGTKYKPFGNKTVQLWRDKHGKDHELDGTEQDVKEIEKQNEEDDNQEKKSIINEISVLIASDIEEENKKEKQDKKEAENEDKIRRHEELLQSQEKASEAIVEAIKGIPETIIPEVKIPDHHEEEKKWKDEIIQAIKEAKVDFDMSPVVEAVRGITLPQIPQPINYMEALIAIKKALPKETDNSELITAIQSIRFPEFPEFPNFKFNRNGNLVVALEEMAVGQGGGSSIDTSTLAKEETLSSIENVLTDQTTTGSLTSLNSTVQLDIHGMGSCLAQVSGTWSGKIEFQGAIDGVWNTLSIFQPTGAITRNGIQNDNQNGLYRVVITSGYTKVRAIMTSYTSGSATILFNASAPVGSSQVWQLNQANLLTTAHQGGNWNVGLSDGLDIPVFDDVTSTVTDTTHETISFYKSTILVATVVVTYSDTTWTLISEIKRTL